MRFQQSETSRLRNCDKTYLGVNILEGTSRSNVGDWEAVSSYQDQGWIKIQFVLSRASPVESLSHLAPALSHLLSSFPS